MRDVMRGIRADCERRGCRILWAAILDGEQQGIDVDHSTPTMSGSEVTVTRAFLGPLGHEDGHWCWSAEQAAAVDAWREQLHRMPLEEIP